MRRIRVFKLAPDSPKNKSQGMLPIPPIRPKPTYSQPALFTLNPQGMLPMNVEAADLGTGVERETLLSVGASIASLPEDFNPHRNIKKIYKASASTARCFIFSLLDEERYSRTGHCNSPHAFTHPVKGVCFFFSHLLAPERILVRKLITIHASRYALIHPVPGALLPDPLPSHTPSHPPTPRACSPCLHPSSPSGRMPFSSAPSEATHRFFLLFPS
jgi:hypothetical protein